MSLPLWSLQSWLRILSIAICHFWKNNPSVNHSWKDTCRCGNWRRHSKAETQSQTGRAPWALWLGKLLYDFIELLTPWKRCWLSAHAVQAPIYCLWFAAYRKTILVFEIHELYRYARYIRHNLSYSIIRPTGPLSQAVSILISIVGGGSMLIIV